MNPTSTHSDPSLLLDPWCRALLAQTVRNAGIDPSPAPDAEKLASAFRAQFKFRQVLEAYAELLRNPIKAEPGELRDQLLRQEPALAAHVALAENCAAALPMVLAGDMPATEALFPGGSTRWVEPIYRDNPWADHFNRLTAEACFQVVKSRCASLTGQRTRILEIGAGTGGTTRFVLKRLAAQRESFDYIYTDVSPGFVQQGKRAFGAEFPQMEFRRLDIEQALADTEPYLSSAHIIIATNVLHATRRISTTLAHVRDLMTDDGLLLLNELTRTDAFAALTFGLLDGWWCFEDGERRLPHGPILSVAGWREALAEGGFGKPAVYGWDCKEDGFQCLFVTAAEAKPAVRGEGVPQLGAGQALSNGLGSVCADRRVPALAMDGGWQRRVRAILARRLGFAEAEIGFDHPFAELGVDSIVAPQFAADLAEALNLPADVVDIYNHASVAMLAEALKHRRPLPTEAAAENSSPPPPQSNADAIAIIGLACRFAGAADTEAYWKLLEEGRDAIAPVGKERWPGAGLNMSAGLLPEADCFDPDFFRLSHAEAEVMDPQQRVFLEECWHALEDAGFGPNRLDGLSCGVFVGVAAQNHPANRGESRAALGNSNAILSARIAYHLNLKGPAVPVDTACSSSLVAIHLAAQSLRDGDCDLALAGGVSVLLCNPSLPRFLVEAGMVSASGQCRAFDAKADGFVPGEGVGVVVLRRLDQSLAQGDRILGVIRASGINQDGRTSGITAPSGPAQTALLQRVWDRAGIDPASLSLVEAHGTGTPLGDPIEVQALSAAFAGRVAAGRCALGSVKPNIGHTLTAAGVASVAKVLLALQHRTIPPSLHYQTPNPRLNLDNSPFYVPCHAEPWGTSAPRRAAVSSFGFSGTNAHAVIEQAPEPRRAAIRSAPSKILILLSAGNKAALERLALRLADWLLRHPNTELADLARTLNAGRAYLPTRAAFIIGDVETLRRSLKSLGEGRQDPTLLRGDERAVESGEAWRIKQDDDLERLARHFISGGTANWECLGEGGRVLSLPGYPFARDRFPLPSEETLENVEALDAILPANDPAFVDHRWDGRAIFPATALLLLAARTLGNAPCIVQAVYWHKPLTADNRTARLRVSANGQLHLESSEGVHAQATVRMARMEEAPQCSAPMDALPQGMGHDEVYRRFSAMGFEYGPAFRVIQAIATVQGRVLARLDWPVGIPHGRIPAIGLLDGVIQSALGLLGGDGQPETVVPVGLERAWLDASRLSPPLRVEIREDQAHQRRGERRLELLAWNANAQIAVHLEGLTVRVMKTLDPVGPLLYRPFWRQAKTLPAQDSLPGQPRVLLFDHTDERVEAMGARTILVQPGRQFRAIARERYELPPGNPEAMVVLVRELTAQGLYPDIWLNLWPLAEQPGLDERLAFGPLTLLHGLNAWLPHRDRSRQLRVLQASRAERLEDADSDPAFAATAALLHSLTEEEPRFVGKALALPSALNIRPWLFAELAELGGTLEIAVDTEGNRHDRSYQALVEPIGTVDLPKDSVYLITGGFGGLGLALARHLWHSRRASLALLGRTPANALARREIDALKAEGARVLEFCADVTDVAALRTVLGQIDERLGKVQTVFHLAGVQADGFLRNLDSAGIKGVLAPKINGTQALLDALADNPATLVAFGSLAGSFGAPGQVPYATANRAMAGLLEQEMRRQTGRRILCLEWGYWDPSALVGGMATHYRDTASVSAATGLAPFLPPQGMELLDRVLAAPLTGRLLLARGRRMAFESFLAGSDASPQKTPAPLKAAAAPEAFLAYLTGIVAEVTHTPKARLGADRALEEFGIDSIMITRLNARLERDLGRVSKTLFFEHPNLRALAGHLALHQGSALATTQNSVAPARQDGRADVGAIAIIGMAGRFPEAADLDAYWRNLISGRVCISEIPPQRWPLAGFYDPNPNRIGTSYSKWGGFIDGVDRFDPLFFNIAPDEAARMDPQERLFLEVAWQCLEDAGLTRAKFGATGERDAGVYVGVMYGDYQLLAQEAAGPNAPIGGASPYWSIANRVSYALGLEGPSLSIDSACSSSLTALHLACQAIMAGDCRTALVGGVNLSLHPGKYIGLSQGRFASSDGRCHSFGEGGDGYVPGEGVAAVLLKPLAAALADGDIIHGVIRASAVNHGGKTNGYTVPNPAAQAAVIRRTLNRCGLKGNLLGYIEAHGTGTRLGDPIEIEGLVRALGTDTPRGAIPLGSAKASIGHLEAAAGLAGLIKVLLQMRHGLYAPMPLSGSVNPDIDFAATPLRLQTEPAAWLPGPDGRRYAGVSSFGAGGANAHVIVQDAPLRQPTADDGKPRAVALSARTQAQTRALAGVMARRLANADDPVTLADLCHTLTVGRESMRWRCAFVADHLEHARTTLTAIAEGRDGHAIFWGEAPDDSGQAPPRPAGNGLADLAQFWCHGGSALWANAGVRQALAARPFLGTRHWLRASAASPALPAQQPASVPDWTRQARPLRDGESAAWIFTLQPDSTLLTHHRVGGERLLPGAAIVAMALELDRGGLKELTWIRPVRAGAEPVRLDFSLRPVAATGTAFSVREAGGAEGAVLASGILAPVEAAVAELAYPAANQTIEASPFYQRLRELGLDYGERFRIVRRLWPSAELSRAELMPNGMAGAAVIDPALLDAAFQSLAGLMGDLESLEAGEAIPVPHTLTDLAILGDPNQARQVCAWPLTGPDEPVQRFALTLTDAAGKAVLQVGGLTARRRAIMEASAPITLLRPAWTHRPGGTVKQGRTLILAAPGAEALACDLAARLTNAVIFSGELSGESVHGMNAETLYYLDTADGERPPPDGDPDTWAESAASRCLRLLAVLRGLGAEPGKASIRRVLIVTRGVYGIHASASLDQASDAAGMHGLAKVAAREIPGTAVLAVDLPEVVDHRAVDLLAAEGGDAAGSEIAYRNGRRFARRLQAVELNSENGLPLANGDACLIVGGAGGVGGALAEHWARNFAARIALVGRRPADSLINALITRLKSLGGDGLYIQADATDPSALNAAVDQAQRAFGHIDLAVHGALTLRDKSLALMDEADFRHAFAPRATAGAAFVSAFAHRTPKALVLFSSANLFLGQHGQGNYVAGNAALAALGQSARARGLPVSLVHWGLWGEVGAVADPAIQARFTADGVLPITPAMGASILPTALAAGSEVAAVRVSADRLSSIDLVEKTRWRYKPLERPVSSAALDARLRQRVPIDSGIEAARTAFEVLENYGLLRVAGILRSMAGNLGSTRLTPARLLKELGIAADYRRLAQTLLRRLADAGWVEERDGLWRLQTHKDTERLTQEQRTALSVWEHDCAWLGANRLLLETCLESYADVLRGQRNAASVLFPDGDTSLVQVAYQGNPVSDRANALLGKTVAAEVEARLQRGSNPVRILEVGAGTGGSTLPLLAELLPWRGSIAYRATDLSPYLAKTLQERSLAAGWQIEAGMLDVGREPEPAERSSYDIIIAANVVHATPDIGATLRHLKSRLLPGGRLVMNELTASRVMGTLVFGLTPQWWAADDADTRLPDGPAVSPAVWLDLLAENGFTDPLLLGAEGEPAASSQSLITALADNWMPVAQDEPEPSIAEAPPAASAGPGQQAMLDYLKNVFATTLGMEPEDLRPGDTFERYGVESLSALEIRNRIAVDYPRVSNTLLFEHNTLHRLAEHLLMEGIPAPASADHNPPGKADHSAVAEANGLGNATRPANPEPIIAPERGKPASGNSEPIAVIGFSGRFPGAETAHSFWELLREGRSALGPVPAERWDHERYLDRGGQATPTSGHCRSRWGGFIDGIDRFDPLFFGIMPLEADTMDPQERLFIETCWNALEDAGTTPARLAGQSRMKGTTGSVGVFCGVMNTAYQWLAAEAWRAGEDQAASSHFWSIPNRVSYLFDFDGPSIAIDTACSSSLTALHLACESLRRGECAAALAGGVNLIAHPRQLVNLGQAGMIAQGVECRAFGAGADGFVDGEGVGVALLKPLSQALADGDRIDGLIVGSAINAGGKTGGFTVPNPRAQSTVIRAALEQAGIEGAGVCLIETHGTGTELGDPIEVAGLMGGLGLSPTAQPLSLGTLKANIGHLESAAGIASLIKVLLQLRHATIAPARHAATPNPLIRWHETPFRLPAEAEPWPKPVSRPRRAAISGFGAGGANAHLIVEEPAALPRRAVPMSPEVIPLSVREPSQLAALAARMAESIANLAKSSTDSQTLLADIGRTLRCGRARQAHCVWIEAHELGELLEALHKLARGEPAPITPPPAADRDGDPRARPVSLPTTPFNRQRHWLNVEPAPPGGVSTLSETNRPSASQASAPPSRKDEEKLDPDALAEAVSTRLLSLRWTKAASPVLIPETLDILLIGGGEALSAALSQLGHRVERLSLAGTGLDACTTRECEQCLVIVEPRKGEADAGPSIRAVLDIARCVARASGRRRVLHVASYGADGEALPVSSAVAALLRSLLAETVGCRAGVLTLDTTNDAMAAFAIAEELTALPLHETRQIRRRGRERLQLEISAEAARQGRSPLAFRDGGLYLLVGGLGEVGKPLAQALLNRHRARIAMLGRTPPNQTTLAQLASLGEPERVSYWSCDIGDLNALEPTLADIRRTQGPINGVLHLARHVAPASLRAMQSQLAAASLSPKVEGSLNLIRALAPHRPDWLAFFSSMAAWAGQAGGADYAAACGFQDGLALAGNAVPLVSVAWPQWEHDRFLDQAKRDLWSSLELATLDAEAGLDALEGLLRQGCGAYGVLRGTEPAIEPIVRRLSGAETAWAAQLGGLDLETLRAYRDYLRERLADKHPPALESPVSAKVESPAETSFAESVMAVCADYLKIPPDILARSSFAELGLDSIRALHLAERLQRRLKRPVEPVMLFANPTVESLSQALAETPGES